MGLDMYLHAKRSFAPDSDDASRILDAANVTLDGLKQIASLDPMEYETNVYLPRWEFSPAADQVKAACVMEAAGLLDFGTEESHWGILAWANDAIEVSVTCIYWRKANAIHAWFVDNCQGGIDECQEAVVHPEQLAQLRSVCLDALTAYTEGDLDKAAEIMTPRSGFFFGGTDIDEWWARDLQHTVTEIERVVNLVAANRISVTFTYQSSW